MENKELKKETSVEINILILLFFVTTFAEVIAEFFSNSLFIYLLKSLLSPLLILIYWKSSKIRNIYFIVALLFVMMSNLFFVSTDFSSLLIGSIFFMFYRILIIYLVVKIVRIKNYIPVLVGSIPFIIIFLYATSLTIDELGKVLYIHIIQVIFMSFLGGFSLSNYVIDNTKINYWLFISCMLFAVIHFILILKTYYLPIGIFQPIVMLVYAFAQFSMYKFIILSEKREIK